jgi:hypothetical protein
VKGKSKSSTQNRVQGIYSAEEIQNISALGDVLREIRARLLYEGVSIENERNKLLVDKRHA